MSKIAAVLSANYRDALWTLDGDTYDGLTWRSPHIAQPTEDEIDAQWPAIQRAQQVADVQNARRAAYQTDSDPLFFEWQRGDGTEQAWLDAVAAVKAAHPYPPAP